MSHTKDALMAGSHYDGKLDGNWQKPVTVTDMLDHAIQKWMEVTGDNGSDARVKIALMAIRILDQMEDDARTHQ
jgi:hypothetical protein